MKEVIDALKRQAAGRRCAADQRIREAEQFRKTAEENEKEAADLRAEADELDRLRIAAYGADEVAK